VANKIEFDLVLVEQYASEGLSEYQIAESFGVSRATIQRNKAEDEAFAAAYKRGQASGVQRVANALFQQAMNGNTTAQIFFLKARAGWKETQVNENHHTGELPVVKIEFVNGSKSAVSSES
jgi:predicted transcriptional regulator